MNYPVLSPELGLCWQSAWYKFCNLTSFIRLRCKIKNINNISLKFMMLTDNNQIFRNCFVIIYCRLTKVSSQINKCIIFEPNKLSITLSTLWHNALSTSDVRNGSQPCSGVGQKLMPARPNLLVKKIYNYSLIQI